MKKLKRILYSLAIIVAVIVLVRVCLLLRPIPGLMEQAGLTLTCIRSIHAVDSWTDWLNYTDGYDYAVLQVDPGSFVPPEDWTRGQSKAGDSHPHSYHDAPLPETFTAWRFDPRDRSLPFDEQTFFAAMYDENTGMLVLYRSHSFYGSP